MYMLNRSLYKIILNIKILHLIVSFKYNFGNVLRVSYIEHIFKNISNLVNNYKEIH